MTAFLVNRLAEQLGTDCQGQFTLGGSGCDVPLPPMHPLAQGHLLLDTAVSDGRISHLRISPRLQHRGDEKLLENRDYRQGLSLINRNNWLMPAACELAYAQACESLMGLRVPDRARALRTLSLALGRLSAELTMKIARASVAGIAVDGLIRQRERVLSSDRIIDRRTCSFFVFQAWWRCGRYRCCCRGTHRFARHRGIHGRPCALLPISQRCPGCGALGGRSLRGGIAQSCAGSCRSALLRS